MLPALHKALGSLRSNFSALHSSEAQPFSHLLCINMLDHALSLLRHPMQDLAVSRNNKRPAAEQVPADSISKMAASLEVPTATGCIWDRDSLVATEPVDVPVCFPLVQLALLPSYLGVSRMYVRVFEGCQSHAGALGEFEAPVEQDCCTASTCCIRSRHR